MASEPASETFAQKLTEGEGQVSGTRELLKWACLKRSDHILASISTLLRESRFGPGKPGFEDSMATLERLKGEMEELLGGY